ncbi:MULTISPECIES: AMP-binding protein [Gammaproteobacteria]|uniref:AMP-binding protein n=1 Tax=Gammaproteobacteria TaxID=1236 RepID=UPI000DD0A73D|nr:MULTISPECIES: AMP-binding protein [Gammaproteobacteria]RTE86605.1 4-coumarate--CoA ligase [Aliidiomarina sp. B3213]TCZ90840.1 4-coumarate--CoA ligase [Lysobacter sp. N42]
MSNRSLKWAPVIGSLIADELVHLRKSDPNSDAELLKSRVWSAQTKISLSEPSISEKDVIFLDSMEWMACATRVVKFFHIHESGVEDYLLRVKTVGQWAEVVEESRKLGATSITFNTSGSTGTPKSIQHDWKALLSEVNFFSSFLREGSAAPNRIIAAVPSHHIYGFLFTVLIPEQLGIEVLRGMRAHSTVFAGKLEAGDIIVAFPGFLNQLVKKEMSFQPDVTIVNSTGPCAVHVMSALKSQGVDTLVDVYGSSETAGIGYRTEPGEPYTLLPRWLKRKEDCLSERDTEREFEIQDRVIWLSEQKFQLGERKDQAVSIKGMNVFPSYVCEKLKLHRDVADARVRAMNLDGNHSLKALIEVARPLCKHEQGVLISDLKEWLSKHLLKHERPVHYTLVDKIPTTEMGKDMDWSIEVKS